jgi:hypothetical protein
MASNHIELQGNESRLAGKFRSAAVKINSAAIDNFINRIG